MEEGHKIQVSINTENITGRLYNDRNIEEIKRSIIKDIEDNIFLYPQTEDAYQIEVIVNVRELDFSSRPWGFFWYPFLFFGAPLLKVEGKADLQLSIYYKDGDILARYDSKSKLVKWAGLYYGYNYDIVKDGGITSMALKQAMEDIKSKLEMDQQRISMQVEELNQAAGGAIYSGSRKMLDDGNRLAVAVVNLESKNVPEGEVSIVSDLFRESLWKTNKFDVLERNQMDKILQEQGLQQTGCTDTECAVQLGRVLNVEEMIVGNLEKLGDLYIIAVRFINVESFKVTLAESVRCKCTVEELPGAIDDLSKTILSYFK